MDAAAPTERHLIVVWETAMHAADRIVRDAERRFAVRDLVRVTWSPQRFRANLSRLYGTDLPADSDKERECGTGPFLVVVVDAPTGAVARRVRDGWSPANASLLASKRRHRRWAGGSYRVHATLTEAEARKDAVLILGEGPGDLGGPTWDGALRERRRDLLGDPTWASLDELERALRATMGCVLVPAGRDAAVEVWTDDPWWAIRIIDPSAAEGGSDAESEVRRVVVGGSERTVVVRGPDDPRVAAALADAGGAGPELTRPTLVDRLATAARLRG